MRNAMQKSLSSMISGRNSSIARRALAGLGLAALLVAGPAAAQQRDYGITVVNGTGVPIEFFPFSSVRAINWFNDRLGSNEVIQPGGSRYFNMYDAVRHCCRDMKATFANKAFRTWMNVDVCSVSQWVVQ